MILDFTHDGHHVGICLNVTLLNDIEAEFRYSESIG